MSNEEKLLDAKAVADMMGIHWRTVIRLAESGQLPAYKVARQWRFRRSDVEEYLERQRYRPQSDREE